MVAVMQRQYFLGSSYIQQAALADDYNALFAHP
jgi:hypothetical protein